MYEIHENVYKKCFTPFDVITDNEGNVGYISEININTSQDEERWQLSYAVTWLVQVSDHPAKNAWWEHEELKKHSNIMESMAGDMAHPFGTGRKSLGLLKDYLQKSPLTKENT